METSVQIKKLLDEGNNFLIFPEGTRTTPGQPMILQRGPANIAVRAKVSITLIHINCSKSCLHKHGKWYNIPEKKVKYCIMVGEQINPGDFLTDKTPPSIAARRLTRYITDKLKRGVEAND